MAAGISSGLDPRSDPSDEEAIEKVQIFSAHKQML